MKRIANYLIALAVAAFTFTSCSDVPSPFGDIIKPATEEAVTIEPIGSGTEADPYNVAALLEYVSGLGADTPSDKEVFFKGYVTETTDISTNYKNATFYISDTEDGTANKFYVFRAKGLGGGDVTDEKFLKEGDFVVMCGKVTNYKGNTPETVQGAAYVVSINGEGGGGTKPEEETKTVSVADFLKAAESTSVWYQLTGTVKNLKDGDLYGNFDLEDATGSVYVYGLLSEKGGEKKLFQELAAAKGIKNGSKLTIIGNRGAYNGNAQVTNAYFVSVEAGDAPADNIKGTGTLADPFNIAAAIAKCKEVGETASTEKYYIKGIVVKGGKASGGYGNVTFKLGDSKDDTELFTAYQVAGTDGEKLADGFEVKEGDEVIVYGPIMNYKGNTPETAGKSAAQIVTINGKKTSEGGSTGGGEITAAFGDLDCSNIASIKLSDGTTLSVAQEDGKSAPIYHENTKIIRIYARNSITVDAGSKKIAKVVLAYDTYQGTAYKGNDEMYGEVGSNKINPSKDDSNVTFSNVNSSKIKVVNWLESGNSGGTQFRITGITITYAN